MENFLDPDLCLTTAFFGQFMAKRDRAKQRPSFFYYAKKRSHVFLPQKNSCGPSFRLTYENECMHYLLFCSIIYLINRHKVSKGCFRIRMTDSYS